MKAASKAEPQIDTKSAEQTLRQLLDGEGSVLIALRNRLTILGEVCDLRLEAPGSGDRDLAMSAFVDDLRKDLDTIEHTIDVAYCHVTGEKAGAR